MKTKIKIGYVGVGRRGVSILKNCLIKMNDVEIAVLCETSDKRIEMAREVFAENKSLCPRSRSATTIYLPIPKLTRCFL